MKEQYYALLGILGPFFAYFFIAVSIAFSPWFDWGTDALSDLGHSLESEVAPLFNLGLLLSGFCIILYSITGFKKDALYTSYMLTVSGLTLQLIATFDEVYVPLHFIVSVLFFVSLGFASLTYLVEKRSILALVALIVGLMSWILYGLEVYSVGIAVPEFISSAATFAWVLMHNLNVIFRRA